MRMFSYCSRFAAVLGCLTVMHAVAISAEEEVPLPQPAPQVERRSFMVTAGNYVFVMVAEGSSSPRPLSSTGQPYLSSGLHRDDGSINPIWTVDWYATEIYVSSDGSHLVAMGPLPAMKGQTRDLSDRALAFYEDGQLLKEHDVGDLIEQPDILPHNDTNYQWKRQVIFDGVDNRLAIRTLDGQAFTFDVATGEILHQRPDE